jgi:hypothetical protein
LMLDDFRLAKAIISDALSAGGTGVGSCKPRIDTFDVESMPALQLVPLLLALLLTNGAFGNLVHFLKMADLSRCRSD